MWIPSLPHIIKAGAYPNPRVRSLLFGEGVPDLGARVPHRRLVDVLLYQHHGRHKRQTGCDATRYEDAECAGKILIAELAAVV